MRHLRLFVAVNFPDKIKQSLGFLIQNLRSMPSDASWVREENIHITIQFLGNVPEDQINAIVNALNRSVTGIVPFHLELRGAGVFPSAERPRVLWLGVSGDTPVLFRLRQQVQKELELLYFKPEGRRFSPHLTLARIRSPLGFSPVLERAQRLMQDNGKKIVSTAVNSIELMQSDLKPGGPKYFVLARVPFPGTR